MKKLIAVLLLLGILMFALGGCVGEGTADAIDDIVGGLEDDFDDYKKDTEPPKSVLDALDQMLDNFVSGISTPPPSSIPSVVLDPDDDDAQDLISGDNAHTADEAELEALILESLRNIETGVSFEVDGNWLTPDLLYDIVFYRIHDEYMIDAFGLYSYTYSYIQNGTGYIFDLKYTYIDDSTPDEVRAMRDEITEKAKEIVNDLDINGKSDYEKISAIDGYLCDTVYYPDAPYITHDFTPYGALIDGRSVCEGYARSTKILCELCGLDCYFVTGYCNNDPVGGGHAWNLVKVDGKWYQLDTTWNDGGNNKDYFLVTDDFMSISRDWDRNRYPASEKTAYSN